MAMTGGTAKLVASGTPPGWPGAVNLYVYYKHSNKYWLHFSSLETFSVSIRRAATSQTKEKKQRKQQQELET